MFKSIGIILLSILVLITPSTASSPKTDLRYGGTLTIGVNNEPTWINPVLTDHSVSSSVMALVFSRLLKIDSQGQLVGDLAQSWEISQDGLIYTFHLHQGVHFHDGVELTAEDVRFTYEAILDPANASPYAASLSAVQEFRAPQPYVFQVVLKEPYAPFIFEFVREILPKHRYEKQNLHDSPLNYAPLGSGPFKFKTFQKQQVRLEANPDYFEGRPYLDQIIFKSYPDSAHSWAAFMRGEVDLTLFMSLEDYKITEMDPSFNSYAYDMPYYYALFYNLNDPELSNLKIRKALAYAINQKRLIEQVEKNHGKACYGPFSESSWGFDKTVASFEYNPSLSEQILENEGWTKNAGGLLEKDGKPLVFKVLVDSHIPKMKKIAMILRQQLQEIGVGLEIVLYEDEKKLREAEPTAQMYLHMHHGGRLDPHHGVKAWKSDDPRFGRIWSNNAFSPEIDRLVLLGQETQDPAQRQIIYHQLHRLIYENQLANFLYFPYFFHGASKKMENTERWLNPFMPDYLIKEIYQKKGGD